APGAPLELGHAAIYQHLQERAYLLRLAALTPCTNRPHQRRLWYLIPTTRRAPLESGGRSRVARIYQVRFCSGIHPGICAGIAIAHHVGRSGGSGGCACNGRRHLLYLRICLAARPSRPCGWLLGLIHQRSLHVLTATRAWVVRPAAGFQSCWSASTWRFRMWLEKPVVRGRQGIARVTV